MLLTITRTFTVADLGTVAFIDIETVALDAGSRHRVRVTRPDGVSLEAIASVEVVRNDASGAEFPALLFASAGPRDVVIGASVVVLGELCEP